MHKNVNFPICQIVGYKNSGKTTLMKKLIRYFKANNLKVGTLKHHGHGGEPTMAKDTDSYEHFEAGSLVSAVQGGKQFQLMVNDTLNYTLSELISFYNFFPIDILLIEGYKEADYPKIILLKSENDLHLLRDLTNIIAVGSWNEKVVEDLPFITFPIAKIDLYLPELAQHIAIKKG